MAKGAYLLGERRRLLNRLGEEAFDRLKSGEWKAENLESLTKQLERTTKKIEIEEKLIQQARFGDRPPTEDETVSVSEMVAEESGETKKEKGRPK